MGEQTSKRPHDVFISYASESKDVADAIVADFEQNGIRCWYAPRDIGPGAIFSEALVSAIKNAEMVVLVFSKESNSSKHVLNEIGIAFQEGKRIVPFRLSSIQMRDALRYYMQNVHWMDATTSPLSKNITALREHISSIIPDKTITDKKNLVLVSKSVETGSVKKASTGEAFVREKESTVISRPSDSPIELTDSWEEIIKAGEEGTYKEKYRIGDTKLLDMASEGVITMKLVAMDEDDLADGSGKAPMTWVADELLQSEHNMNLAATNAGGWEKSEMRSWLQEDILPLMAEEVRKSIREVTKYSYSYDVKGDIKTKDKIWIPSEREVFLGDHDESWPNDQTGAAYTEVFNSNESRMRLRAGASGASWWWLRSADDDYDSYFRLVRSDGSNYFNNSASPEGGVVVGFCL